MRASSMVDLFLRGVVTTQHPVEHIGKIVFLPGAALDLFEAFIESQWFAKKDMSKNKGDQSGDSGQVRDS